MDTDKDLEVLLRRATFTTTGVEDVRLLADASAALARGGQRDGSAPVFAGGERPATAPRSTSPSQTSVSPKRLAMLTLPPAIVAATILIALFGWTYSPDITWGQVVETVRKKPWMHFVSKGGPNTLATETWYSEEHGILASKCSVSLIFNDRINNITEKCDPRPSLVHKRIERYSPMTQEAEQNFIVFAFFDAAMSGDTKTPIVVDDRAQFVPQGESKIRHDGQTLLEYGFELVLAKPDPKIKPRRITIQVDPQTRLPQKWISWIRDNGRWSVLIEATIDYPLSGPKDIYELGAPRDYKIELRE